VKDGGRPPEIGFQERVSNQSKRRRSKGAVVSVGSKVRREFGQVSIRETIEREPSLTRRNSIDVARTRGGITLWEESAGDLIIGRAATGVEGA